VRGRQSGLQEDDEHAVVRTMNGVQEDDERVVGVGKAGWRNPD
jgi:hypothetical protein